MLRIAAVAAGVLLRCTDAWVLPGTNPRQFAEGEEVRPLAGRAVAEFLHNLYF
jgi:hypothetical protein